MTVVRKGAGEGSGFRVQERSSRAMVTVQRIAGTLNPEPRTPNPLPQTQVFLDRSSECEVHFDPHHWSATTGFLAPTNAHPGFATPSEVTDHAAHKPAG